MIKKIPRKYQPRGFEILYEDSELIIGNKAAGVLTVAANYEKERTVHQALNQYVRKGNSKSRKYVFVVHRLDRETSGVLVFAKSIEMQMFLKDNWKDTQKIYYAIVHGKLTQKKGTISSYLEEDEDYHVHSRSHSSRGKLAQTAYSVIKETEYYSLLKITLLTGRKNQIRVHFAEEGYPIVGDTKYGFSPTNRRYERLALHARSFSFEHPATKEPITIEAPVPEFFHKLVGKW